MGTTPSNSPATDLKFSGYYQDSLKNTWETDEARPWDVYMKKQHFSYFWDTRVVEHRQK